MAGLDREMAGLDRRNGAWCDLSFKRSLLGRASYSRLVPGQSGEEGVILNSRGTDQP